MPLMIEVGIPSSRNVEAPLNAALKALEPECPVGEAWLVTVVEDQLTGPGVTVFREYRSRARPVPHVGGWTFHEEDGPEGTKKPVFFRAVPILPGQAEAAWIAGVVDDVRGLLRALQP